MDHQNNRTSYGTFFMHKKGRRVLAHSYHPKTKAYKAYTVDSMISHVAVPPQENFSTENFSLRAQLSMATPG